MCRICGNATGNVRHRAREMMFGTRERFDYLECDRCGTLQLLEVPDDLGRYYPKGYYAFDPQIDFAFEGWKRRLGARAVANWYGRRRNALGKHLAATRPWAQEHFPEFLKDFPVGITVNSRILDVGSGAGRLLLELREFGFRCLVGADAFIESDIHHPNGVRVLKRRLDELQPSWDLVMLHHSFEHLPDPVGTLGQLHRLLRAGKYAIVRMPVVASAWKRYGVDWFQLDPPRHMFLFTERGFRDLAAAAGFVLDHVTYDSNEHQFWMSEQYRQDVPMFDPRSHFVDPDASMFEHGQIVEWKRQADELNRQGAGDQAAFYLRKR
jgi:SAM-dependent methyltransferase